MKNTLSIKPSDQCHFDLVSLGEVMIRLDPAQLASAPHVTFKFGKAAENTTWLEDCDDALGCAPLWSAPLPTTKSGD